MQYPKICYISIYTETIYQDITPMPKLVNKIISINKRRTSMRLCTIEWEALDEICERENISRNKLIEKIEGDKDKEFGLAYSTRLFMVQYFRNAANRPRRNVPVHNNIIQTIKYISH